MVCCWAPWWRSRPRTIMTASQASTTTARTAPAVSAAMRITSRAMWTILATIGPILATINVPIRMSATAAMPAPWPRELSQHDGLHMTGRRRVGSVDHATHLFRMGTDGFLGLAGPGDGRPPGPVLVSGRSGCGLVGADEGVRLDLHAVVGEFD